MDIPNDNNIECKVLAALMNTSDAIHIIASVLQPSSFYTNDNRMIYVTCIDLYNASKIPDMSLVAAELKGKVDLITISNIAGEFCDEMVLPDYCRVLKELEMRRDMLAAERFARQRGRLRRCAASGQAGDLCGGDHDDRFLSHTIY